MMRVGSAYYLCLVFLCAIARAETPANAPASSPVLKSIREVRVLSPEKAASKIPVAVRGVVTHANPYIGDFFIDDGTNPIYVTPGGWKEFVAGDKVQVTGVSNAGGFAPCIVASKVEKEGSTALPDPLPYDLSLEDSRWLDAHYVQSWAMIESVGAAKSNYALLRATTAKGSALLLIPGTQHVEAAKKFLKQPVKVRGVCVPTFNARKVVNAPARIFVQSLSDIEILQNSSVDMAGAHSTLLGSLYQFIPDAHPQTRRVKTLGTVTAVESDKVLYIRDVSAAARVRLVEPLQARPGDVLEVVGMLMLEGASLSLDRAAAKVMERVLPPEPVSGTLADVRDGKFAYDLIELEGLVTDARDGQNRQRVVLRNGETPIEANFTGEFPHKQFRTGSRVAVVGILDGDGTNAVKLVAADTARVRLLETPAEPPYWTSQRVAVAVGGALLLAAAVGAWAYTLRRRVEQQRRMLQAQFDKQSALELQMRQSQKIEALGRMAGGIAHDFNNLLTVILGSCDMLRMDAALKRESQDLVGNVRKAGERAAALTRQMLVFSRQRPVSLSPIDLNAAVADAAKMVGRLIGEHITMHLSLVQGSPTILASEDLINQIMMNLGANARDAISDAGEVWISTAPHGEGRVRLTFRDSGCGMDSATKEHMFEPFFTTKEVGKGTGLGLATVFGIVKTLGASIVCESEKGKGTVFHIDFPLSKTAAETSVDLVPPGPPVEKYRGLRILLVEDNPGIMELTAKNLRTAGFEVLTALSPRQAVQLWRENKNSISLLVTDVVMPERSGRELADELQKDKPALKVLFMSGYTADELLLRGVKEDRMVLLQKPFTGTQLLEKIYVVLDERRLSSRRT